MVPDMMMMRRMKMEVALWAQTARDVPVLTARASRRRCCCMIRLTDQTSVSIRLIGETDRDRETERQTERETDRERQRERDRETERERQVCVTAIQLPPPPAPSDVTQAPLTPPITEQFYQDRPRPLQTVRNVMTRADDVTHV